MKQVIDTSEVIGLLEFSDGEWEIFATAVATYDAQKGEVVIHLDSFLRSVGVSEKERHTRPDWMPAARDVRERSSYEEAADIARDVFHRWVKQVRQAAPAFHAPGI